MCNGTPQSTGDKSFLFHTQTRSLEVVIVPQVAFGPRSNSCGVVLVAKEIMAQELSPQEKVALIHSNLQEVLDPEIIERIVVKENRPLTIYLGIFCVSANVQAHMLTHR